MSENRAVAYKKPAVVEVIDIDYPTFELKDGPGVNPANVGRKVPHGVIVKTVTTNICGSDQHMVRGSTSACADGARASAAAVIAATTQSLPNLIVVLWDSSHPAQAAQWWPLPRDRERGS